MSTKENNDVAVDKKVDEKAGGDAKCEIKGTKRPAEVCETYFFLIISFITYINSSNMFI